VTKSLSIVAFPHVLQAIFSDSPAINENIRASFDACDMTNLRTESCCLPMKVATFVSIAGLHTSMHAWNKLIKMLSFNLPP
jgi:hypothetical protein